MKEIQEESDHMITMRLLQSRLFLGKAIKLQASLSSKAISGVNFFLKSDNTNDKNHYNTVLSERYFSKKVPQQSLAKVSKESFSFLLQENNFTTKSGYDSSSYITTRESIINPATKTKTLRGIEEFFDRNRLPTEPVQVGREWTADELRRKSFSDLHKLWYILYKERNVLLTEKQLCRRGNAKMQAPHRMTMVKKSMARILLVLRERAIEEGKDKTESELIESLDNIKEEIS